MTIQFKAFHVKEERTNIPTPTQFRVEQNPSYANSLIAGVFSPILHLPQIYLFGCVWPFLRSLFKATSFIFLSMIAGVLGKASGYRVVDVEESSVGEDEKREAIEQMLVGTGYIAITQVEYAQLVQASIKHEGGTGLH